MTLQEEVARRIAGDPLLARLRRKIDGKNADFKDTAAYSNRAADIMSEIFARRLPELSLAEREALCVELLRDRHTDINELLSRVQLALDDAAGIHIAPQHVPFNSERAHQIGRSTADPTVSEETQQRRARSAPATAARAMHDDYIRKNADFRSKAGLKSFIERIGASKCCEWCDAVTGKYPFNEAPHDVFRRHDNCECTVIYANGRTRQTLQGGFDADGRRSKKWEIIAEDAGAPEPVRLTKEQARKLQEKHQLTVLTKPAESGTMRLADSDDFWHPITEHAVHSIPQVSAFSGDLNTVVQQQCRELLSSLIEDEIGTEGTISIRLRDFTSEIAKGESGEGGVKPIHLTEPYISIHNHPSDETFSALDLRLLCTDDQCRAIIVVGNSGETIFVLQKTDAFDADGMMRYIRTRIDHPDSDETLEEFVKGSERYGTKYHK